MLMISKRTYFINKKFAVFLVIFVQNKKHLIFKNGNCFFKIVLQSSDCTGIVIKLEDY